MKTPESLPLSKQIYFSLGQLGWSILINIVTFQLLYFYRPPENADFPYFITQAEFLLVLNAITLLLAGGRLFDAVTDPLIASYSDRSTHKKGRRIPFMAVASIPTAVFCVLMFMPPYHELTTTNLVWLGIMQVLFFFFLTVYLTPYFALIAELGHTSEQRLNLATYTAATWALGLLVSATTPALANVFAGAFDLERIASFQVAVAVLAVIGALLMLLPVFTIEERRYCASEPSSVPLMPALRHALKDSNFRFYVIADMTYFCAITLLNTGLIFFTTVLLFPEDRIKGESMPAALGGIMVIGSALLYPVVNILARKLGKKMPIVYSFIYYGFLFTYIYFLGSLPFSADLQGFLLAIAAAVPLAFLGVLPNAVLADIAEHDGRKTGVRQEGLYFAARTLLQKFGVTAGTLIFAALTTFGKDPGDDLGIRLTGPLGLILCVIAAAFFLRYDEKKIQKELKELGEGS